MDRKRHIERRPGRGAVASRPAIGDIVVARDGKVGRVARLLRRENAALCYLVVATGRFRRRYPVIECGLVTGVEAHVVRVRGDRHTLRRLPEELPIVL